MRIPHEGEAVPADGYYLSLCRITDGRLVAVISDGHPNAGDGKTVVCQVKVVLSRKAATLWFAKALLTKPWIPRN